MKKTVLLGLFILFTTGMMAQDAIQSIEATSLNSQTLSVECKETALLKAKEMQRVEKQRSIVEQARTAKQTKVKKSPEALAQYKKLLKGQQMTRTNSYPQLLQKGAKAALGEPYSLPFTENFASEAETELNWTFLDRNQDNDGYWLWYEEPGPDGEEGSIHYQYSDTMDADDWAMLNEPLTMSVGAHFVELYYFSMGLPESFELYIGKDFDPATMTKIGGLSGIELEEWLKYRVTFNIEEAGNYYFAIHATSEADMGFLFIDDIKIDYISDDYYTLPFYEDFTPDGSRWEVIDANSDEASWIFGEGLKDEVDTKGMGYYGAMAMADGDDYLLLKKPVRMQAGNNHVSFDYFTVNGNESLELYYGSTDDVTTMKKIGAMDGITNFDWETYVCNFELPEDGDYYFAVKATSPLATSIVIWITRLTIDAGEFVTFPDLTIESIELPLGGKPLSNQEKLGLTIYNNDLGRAASYTVYYVVNEGPEKSQTFNTAIFGKARETLYLTEAIDFSALRDYSIGMRVEVTGDTNLENNGAETVFRTKNQATIPYHHLLESDYVALDWQAVPKSAWKYDASNIGVLGFGTYVGSKVNAPLYTDAISFEAGVYDLSFTYHGGYDYSGMFELTDDFMIFIGKADKSYDEYELVESFSDLYNYENGNPVFVDYKTQVNISEAGDYRVAFVSKDLAALYIGNLEINKALEHDVAIVELMPQTMLLQVPLSQAKDVAYNFNVKLANRGSNAETANVNFFMNDQKVDEDKDISLALAATVDLNYTGTFSATEKGVVKFAAEAVIGNDELVENNNMTTEIEVGNTFAWDKGSDFASGLGSNSSTMGLGQVYTLIAPAELESVTLGLTALNTARSMELQIHKLAEDTLTVETTLMVLPVARPAYNPDDDSTYGYVTYDLAGGLTLAPGHYYFEAFQTKTENIAIAYDKNPMGWFYSRDAGANVVEMTQNTNWGFLVIRPNFKEGGSSLNFIESKAKVFPSITNGEVNVITDGDASIRVMDITGRLLESTLSDGDTKLNLNYVNGVYLILVEEDGKLQTHKIVLSR